MQGWQEEDKNSRSAEAFPATTFVGGAFTDFDAALVALSGGAYAAGKFGARALSAAGSLGKGTLRQGLLNASKTAATVGNAAAGDFAMNRTANAVANMALSGGLAAGSAIVGENEFGATDFLWAVALPGAAGYIFPKAGAKGVGKVIGGTPTLKELPKSSGVVTRDSGLPELEAKVSAAAAETAAVFSKADVVPDLPVSPEFGQRLKDAMAVVRELDPVAKNVSDDALAALTPFELAAYGLHQITDRYSKTLRGWKEGDYWAKTGAADDALFHLDTKGSKAGRTFDAEEFGKDVQGLFSKFLPGSRLLLQIVDEVSPEVKMAKGGFHWAGENTAVIKIKSDLLYKNTADATETAVHEIGHAVTMRFLHSALVGDGKKADMHVLEHYMKAFERHITGLKDDASGSYTAGDMASRLVPKDVTTPSSMHVRGVANPGELRKYFDSPLEWLAQQFTKDIQDVVREAKIGRGDSALKARESALFKSLPENVQNLMLDVISSLKGVWDWWFDKGLQKASPEFHTFFENIAANPKRLDNYSNFEQTAVNVASDGVPLEKYATQEFSIPPPPPKAAGEGAEVPVDDPITEGQRLMKDAPYAPAAYSSGNTPKMLRWIEDRVGAGAYSLFENLNQRGGYMSALAHMLVHDGAGKNAFSAVQFKRTAETELTRLRLPFDNALTEATGITGWQRMRNGPEFRKAYEELGTAVREDLMRKFNAYADGQAIPVNPDERIENLSQIYAKTGYANKSLEYQKTSGRFGSELIKENPWYVPMKMSSDSLRDLARKGVNDKDVKEFLKLQLKQMFPGHDDGKMARIADGVHDGIIQRGMGRASTKHFFEGTTLDELEQAMASSGFDKSEIQGFLERFRRSAEARTKDSSLRARLDWDWDLEHIADNGEAVRMRDLVGKDLLSELESHQRVVSGQFGMGMVGLKSNADLYNVIEAGMADYRGRGASASDLQYVSDTLKGITDSLLGRAVGERIPPLIRASSSLSSSIVLKNTAFYMAVDTMHAMHNLGAGHFLKNAVLKGDALKALKGVEREQAEELASILSERFTAEGRWRTVKTHMEDGYEISGAAEVIGEKAAALGRLANGSEFLRRKLANVTTNIVVAELFKAARKGGAEATFMAKYGATPELLKKIKAELDKAPNGHELAWDGKTLAEAEAVLMNAVDQIVQHNRMGEIPAFLQFSSAGKVLLPFTGFIAGSFNKVFLKGLQDEDSMGFALMCAYQVTGGAMAEALRNISAGREPLDSGNGKKFIARAVSNANVSSWFGMFIDSLNGQGGMGGSVHFAFPEAVRNLLTQHDAKAVANLTFLGTIPGMGALVNLADED